MKLFSTAISYLLFLSMCFSANAQCWQLISTNESLTTALRTDGTIWVSGSNINGQLGNGPVVNVRVFTQVGTDNTWRQISMKGSTTHALKADGTLWGWGYNGFGQIGDGTVISKNVPTQVGVAADWKVVATGFSSTAAIKQNGTLWGWGFNHRAQVGDGTVITRRIPVQLGTATNWQTVEGGDTFTLALKQDGSLWSWGVGDHGILGSGNTFDRTFPQQVGTATDWKLMSAGQQHAFAIKQDGTLWAWGNNFFGQLGTGTTDDELQPVQIGVDNSWQSVTAGKYFSVGIKQDGTLWAWGYNISGQFGNGTMVDSWVPVQIGTATDWKTIAVYQGYTTLVIKKNGSLWGWGVNNEGQLADGTITDRIVPASIGSACTAALPVTLLQFSGKNYGMQNLLQWSTATEINNRFFTVEKSNDAVHFSTIGTVAAVANPTAINEYKFTDAEAVEAINYYRLKQTDIDGRYQYSRIIKLQGGTAGKQFIYPNPAKDVFFIGNSIKNGNYSILSTGGQIMQSGRYKTGESIAIGQLPTGVYVVKVENAYYKMVKN